MKTSAKLLKIPVLLLLSLSSLFLVQQTKIQPVSAIIYNSEKTASGGSNYTLYLDLSSTTWTRGSPIYFDVGLTVDSFGSGITDFHAIEIWMKFDNGSGYIFTSSLTGGVIDTVGLSFKNRWFITPTIAMADSFSLYIGSRFYEEAGVSDPYTNDGWTSMVNITVNNPAAPTVTHPGDQTINEGEPDARIYWTVTTTLSPFNYEIYENNSLFEVGIWTAQVPLFYSLNYLPIGDFNITLVAYDDYNQACSDSVIVYVRDLQAPEISSPEDMVIEESATGEYLTWSAYDLHPESYQLLRDGVVIDSDTWDQNTYLNFPLNNLIVGTYNYCLVLTDESNNVASDCVMVEVVQTTRSGGLNILVNVLALISVLSVSSILKKK